MSNQGRYVDAFIEATDHAQLSQRKVAHEIVFALRYHVRLTPPVLRAMAVMMGLPGARLIETGKMIATWLMDDGWVHVSARPFIGVGMSAVNAYEPTDKWKRFIGVET